jgi:NitT/TauT family transport system substrate-binding protein
MRFAKTLFALAAVAVSAGAANAADPVKIRVAWVAPVANWASILLEKKDLMQHHGKTYVMEPTRFQATPAMITALATNELEVANLAFSSFALAVENAGLTDLRIIADEFQDGVPDHYSNEFMVLKDGPIQKVTDLKGKIVATNAAGSGADIAQRIMLRKNGLEEKRDYTVVEIALPNMKAALIEKKIDLGTATLPFSYDPEYRNAARPLFAQREAIGLSQFVFWQARSGFIAKNRAAMVDFMEDTLRVVRFFVDPKNHKEAVEIAARVTKLPPERFDAWLFTNKDFYRDPNMLPNLDALQANLDAQRELGFTKTKLDAKQLADLSIVQEAVKRIR